MENNQNTFFHPFLVEKVEPMIAKSGVEYFKVSGKITENEINKSLALFDNQLKIFGLTKETASNLVGQQVYLKTVIMDNKERLSLVKDKVYMQNKSGNSFTKKVNLLTFNNCPLLPNQYYSFKVDKIDVFYSSKRNEAYVSYTIDLNSLQGEIPAQMKKSMESSGLDPNTLLNKVNQNLNSLKTNLNPQTQTLQIVDKIMGGNFAITASDKLAKVLFNLHNSNPSLTKVRLDDVKNTINHAISNMTANPVDSLNTIKGLIPSDLSHASLYLKVNSKDGNVMNKTTGDYQPSTIYRYTLYGYKPKDLKTSEELAQSFNFAKKKPSEVKQNFTSDPIAQRLMEQADGLESIISKAKVKKL